MVEAQVTRELAFTSVCTSEVVSFVLDIPTPLQCFVRMEENKAKQDPFAEYMWMENMDDFDRQVEEQLLEEEFIRTCIEQLLEEEDERETLTAAEIMAQQQLQNLQVKNAGQQGTSQGLFRNSFQSNTAYSNGYTNGFSSYDHNVVVSSGIASVFECFIVVFIVIGDACLGFVHVIDG